MSQKVHCTAISNMNSLVPSDLFSLTRVLYNKHVANLTINDSPTITLKLIGGRGLWFFKDEKILSVLADTRSACMEKNMITILKEIIKEQDEQSSFHTTCCHGR